MKKRKMLPAYQKLKDELDQRPPLCSTSFKKFSVITVSLPLFSFVFCVGYSLIYHFVESTSTHCHTWNYLPSISVSVKCYIEYNCIFSARESEELVFQLVLFFSASRCVLRSTLSWFFSQLQAAIGQFQPQAFVWQVCIIIHFIPRLIILWMYKRWASVVFTHIDQWWCVCV